jgi:hypothetical protein
MDFLKEPKSLLKPDSEDLAVGSVDRDNLLFVYIKLPVDLDPFERSEKFADPLQEALETAGLGRITGGGTQFSEPDSEGEDHVEFCGIDVDLYDVKKGLDLLHRELRRLEAPPGTALLYQRAGKGMKNPSSEHTNEGFGNRLRRG